MSRDLESPQRRCLTCNAADHSQEDAAKRFHRWSNFFFSCISSVCSNPNVKQTRSEQDSQQAETDTYPSVAFFIVYEPSEWCNDNTFFATLCNHEVEPMITPIRVRNHGNKDMETAARQLFQVVKDHNNRS